MKWYIAKKKTETRWSAYELDEEPEVRSDYEMKGPYKNVVECLMAANPPKKAQAKQKANTEEIK